MERISTRDEVDKLKKELAFWEEVHKYEWPDWREFELADKIEQLENCDEFGIPRYNGTIRATEAEDDYIPGPNYKTCKYCGRQFLRWGQYNGKWRLYENGNLHICKKND